MSLDGDPIRLLAARSELGYVEVPALAIRDEPEAVDERTQIELTHAARRRRAREQRGDWRAARGRILAAITSFRQVGQIDRQVTDALRVIERGIARVDRHLDQLAR